MGRTARARSTHSNNVCRGHSTSLNASLHGEQVRHAGIQNLRNGFSELTVMFNVCSV
ncbi:MAG: hypothetical protein AVDCRST_MAG93-7945 [uncultured Chloroflexia bacterium]|uniref:Uncharacterized protein n=1 Tax=uncultured Chloroflexia bacterium TaxID=1672391 RepID=A0A6J4MPY8_9CHLR|nr:MAG: hypothetical protein AVDCRST_MAG93-7945 [uncultured Chloroflexia bacterium]